MQNLKLITSVSIVVVVAGGIGGYAMYQKSSSQQINDPVPPRDDMVVDATPSNPVKQTPTPTTTTPPPTTTPTDTTKKTAKYKDGTYSATGSYNSPGGPDQLGVSITIKNDIVTAATVTNMAGDPRSKNYQDKFISGYQSFVIGKNIDSLNLHVVSGASLTPIGFNDALSQIKTKAKA